MGALAVSQFMLFGSLFIKPGGTEYYLKCFNAIMAMERNLDGRNFIRIYYIKVH